MTGTSTPKTEPLLAGYKICDFTRVLSGPYCTRLLSDLGADVIKIERPGEGDEVRYISPQMDSEAKDQSAYFARTNAGKRSIAIDFANPAAREVVLDLVRQADVVVENFSPGVMAKYKFDFDNLKAVNPNLVYCSISGFGQNGPLRGLQAYAHLINAFSGMMELDRGGVLAPRASNLQAADVLAGAHAFGLTCAALLRRAKTGQGAYLDVSMLECLICADDVNFSALLNGAEATRRPRAGMVVQPVGDGHVALQVGGGPAMWPSLAGLMKRPDLLDDPRFATIPLRVAHRDLLVPLLETITATRTIDAWVSAMEAVGVPCGPINTIDRVFADPQVRARGMRLALPHQTSGSVPSVANPIHFSSTPIRYGEGPPALGQHTRAVLQRVLGADDDMLRQWAAQGTIKEAP